MTTRARACVRAGRGDRCRQGLGQGVRAGASRAGRRVSKVWDVPPAAAQFRAGRAAGRRGYRAGQRRVDLGLLADLFYVLEAAGLAVQLVNARDVKNVPGRPKTDKLDAVWLAKLTEKGLLRPSVRAARADTASCVTTPGCGST